MDVTIHPFTIDHFEDVLSLWQSSQGLGLSDADSRENIQAYLDRNPSMSFVGLAAGRVCGAVLAGHDGRRGYLHHLAVGPAFRRQGLGRRLVERALEALQGQGIRKCHLFVLRDNGEAVAFWESAGWKTRQRLNLMSRELTPPPADSFPGPSGAKVHDRL